MTNQHPITPPIELVHEWCRPSRTGEIHFCPQDLATRAARWGADQELEECAEWLKAAVASPAWVKELHIARRPKPPSLREQALAELGDVYDKDKIDDTTYDTIRRALEALPND